MREKASKAGCPSFSQLLRNSLVELIGVHHTWQQLVTPGNSWSQLFFGGTLSLSLFFCYPSEKSASWCRNITDRRWTLPPPPLLLLLYRLVTSWQPLLVTTPVTIWSPVIRACSVCAIFQSGGEMRRSGSRGPWTGGRQGR